MYPNVAISSFKNDKSNDGNDNTTTMPKQFLAL